MTPLVSVLIPCYNAAPWLRSTLESVLRQTWPRVEIIVVDDGSRDESAAIARRFADRGVRVLEQSNRGQSAAFNLALRHAQGDFVEFLDADDQLSPDKLERQIALLGRHAPGTVCACAWARFRDDPAEAVFRPEPVWRDLAPVDWLVTSWDGGGMMHGAAWLAPMSVVRKTGFWDEALSLTNDFDFFTRLLLESPLVAFCGEARTYYRSGNTTSLSNAKGRKALQSAYQSIVQGTRALLARENSARTRHASATSYMRFVHSYYPEQPDIMRAAETAARNLGGSRARAQGGKAFLVLSHLVGWKAARRLQRTWHSHR